MVNFFLDRLHANDAVIDAKDPLAVHALDCKHIACYDIREIIMQLAAGTPVGKCVDLSPLFYNRLFLAYLINDTAFDNTSWGFSAEDYRPLRYVPKTPFASKDTFFKYTIGTIPLSIDYLITVNRNKLLALEVCKVLSSWYKDRNEMYIDYSKKCGMKNVVEWSDRFHDIDSRAHIAYISILALLDKDSGFKVWLDEQPTTACTELINNVSLIGTSYDVNSYIDVLGYVLNYLKEVTSSVASGRA